MIVSASLRCMYETLLLFAYKEGRMMKMRLYFNDPQGAR